MSGCEAFPLVLLGAGASAPAPVCKNRSKPADLAGAVRARAAGKIDDADDALNLVVGDTERAQPAIGLPYDKARAPLCEEPVTFRGPGLPFAPRNPTDDREGTSSRLLARAFSEMQAPGPGGVEWGPLRGTGDFPGKLGGFPRGGRSLWCEAQAEISRKMMPGEAISGR